MRSDDVSPYLMVTCAAGAREKSLRTFAHSVLLFNKIVLPSLVCWFVGLLVCWCIDVDPLNATGRACISAAKAAM